MQKSFGKKIYNKNLPDSPMGMIDPEEKSGPDLLLIACIAMVVLAAGLMIYRTFLQSPPVAEPIVIENITLPAAEAEVAETSSLKPLELRATADPKTEPN